MSDLEWVHVRRTAIPKWPLGCGKTVNEHFLRCVCHIKCLTPTDTTLLVLTRKWTTKAKVNSLIVMSVRRNVSQQMSPSVRSSEMIVSISCPEFIVALPTFFISLDPVFCVILLGKLSCECPVKMGLTIF